jgi:hypothetical protein
MDIFFTFFDFYNYVDVALDAVVAACKAPENPDTGHPKAFL